MDIVRPFVDIALPALIVSHGDHGAVGPEPHRVIVACGDHKVDVLKVGGDGAAVVHDDGGCGVINTGNAAHIASLVDKAIARLKPSHQVNHRSFIIGKGPLSRGDYGPSSGTGDSEGIRLTTAIAYHPANQGYRN